MTSITIARHPDTRKTRPSFRCAVAECIHLQEMNRRPVNLDDWWRVVGLNAPRPTVERNWERFKARVKVFSLPIREEWDDQGRKGLFILLTKLQVDLI